MAPDEPSTQEPQRVAALGFVDEPRLELDQLLVQLVGRA